MAATLSLLSMNEESIPLYTPGEGLIPLALPGGLKILAVFPAQSPDPNLSLGEVVRRAIIWS